MIGIFFKPLLPVLLRYSVAQKMAKFFTIMAVFCLTAQGLADEEGTCTCGGFELSSEELQVEDDLPGKVACTDAGVGQCIGKCMLAVAKQMRDGGAVLCQRLNRDVDNLKMELYAKICNANEWIPTGQKMERGICCRNGKIKSC